MWNFSDMRYCRIQSDKKHMVFSAEGCTPSLALSPSFGCLSPFGCSILLRPFFAVSARNQSRADTLYKTRLSAMWKISDMAYAILKPEQKNILFSFLHRRGTRKHLLSICLLVILKSPFSVVLFLPRRLFCMDRLTSSRFNVLHHITGRKLL